MEPSIYVVHSKEDRTRFVELLSVAFQRVGARVESDSWQISGRDSLIDRIFREGLKDAAGLVLVLSRFNAVHEWTRYELDPSVIERIESITRLAVLLLDGREAPDGISERTPVFSVQKPGDLVELSTLLQELGPALLSGNDDFASEASERSDAPDAFHVSGLDDTETMLLALACRCAIEKNSLLVKAEDVNVLAEPLQLDEDGFRLAMESLDLKDYISAKRAAGAQISALEVERHSFGIYMNHVLDDFDEIVADLAAEIVRGVRDNETLVERSELPPLVVTYILDDLDEKGHITVIKQMRGHRRIKRLSPEFLQMYSGPRI